MLLLLFLAACSPENGLVDGNVGGGETGLISDPLTDDTDHDGTVDAYDCAPENVDIHPGAAELCDNLDNDCNGVVDGVFDDDGDGYDLDRRRVPVRLFELGAELGQGFGEAAAADGDPPLRVLGDVVEELGAGGAADEHG